MMNVTLHEEKIVKINVMGGCASRKGGVVAKFTMDKYLDEIDVTIEDVYHCTRNICYNNEIENVTFSLYDILFDIGVYRASELWIRENEHFVLVYSIDIYSSLDFLKQIIKLIARTHTIGEEPVYITVIGNNCHLRNSSNMKKTDEFVATEYALDFVKAIPRMMCQFRGIGGYDDDDSIVKQKIDEYVSVSFWEVSDKTGLNIEKAFINHYAMEKIFKYTRNANINTFQILDRNKLLLICFGFGKDCKRILMIPKDMIMIMYEYLDGIFFKDKRQSSTNQLNKCCCAII